MIAVIDNYDSFTYNLVQYFRQITPDVSVFRNDETDVEYLTLMKPAGIVISPGPGHPESAGISLEVIRTFAGKVPMLGVCLGHQAIAHGFGGKVVSAKQLMHGKTSLIYHDGKTIYEGLPGVFPATRYHSLIVEGKGFAECLEISAWTPEGEVMGLRHREFKIEGVQFHPESILTKAGFTLIQNFVRYAGIKTITADPDGSFLKGGGEKKEKVENAA